jgi:hypothetical protein
MSGRMESAVRPARRPVTARLALLRRSSLGVLVLLVAEYGIGMYVNRYVTVPRGDRGGGLGTAISAGPAVLSVHVVIGLLLGLGALGVAAQAVLARHWAAAGLALLGLAALAIASAAGTGFTGTGSAADSMAMSVMTGVALLCYAVIGYALRPAAGRREP